MLVTPAIIYAEMRLGRYTNSLRPYGTILIPTDYRGGSKQGIRLVAHGLMNDPSQKRCGHSSDRPLLLETISLEF
jgi:hypothetical protein